MKCRVIKSKLYPIRKYVPQWYDTKRKQWKCWGNYYNEIQSVHRYASKRQAIRFTYEWQNKMVSNPHRLRFEWDSSRVW